MKNFIQNQNKEALSVSAFMLYCAQDTFRKSRPQYLTSTQTKRFLKYEKNPFEAWQSWWNTIIKAIGLLHTSSTHEWALKLTRWCTNAPHTITRRTDDDKTAKTFNMYPFYDGRKSISHSLHCTVATAASPDIMNISEAPNNGALKPRHISKCMQQKQQQHVSSVWTGITCRWIFIIFWALEIWSIMTTYLYLEISGWCCCWIERDEVFFFSEK